MNNIIDLEKEKNCFVEKQREIKRLVKRFKKIRDINIAGNLANAELYNKVYCELEIYRVPKKVEIKNDMWKCPTCESPVNKKGYIRYCDFCGQALITPLNGLLED